MERGIYENKTRMYAPYYRQITFPVYSLNEKEQEKYLDIAYKDIKNSFEYYMDNFNNDRPILLAGFSQGSQHLIRLLGEYFDKSEYKEKLIAAYCIGWRITDEDLDKYPHLSMAKGEKDTGVIISFNTEAEGVTESLMVPKNIKTYGINPLNWKTDSTLATKEENLGACFTNYSGKIEKEMPNLTGGYLDRNRGTLKVTDINSKDYINDLFPEGIYHLNDYLFFYKNLQENVETRIEEYLKNH